MSSIDEENGDTLDEAIARLRGTIMNTNGWTDEDLTPQAVRERMRRHVAGLDGPGREEHQIPENRGREGLEGEQVDERSQGN